MSGPPCLFCVVGNKCIKDFLEAGEMAKGLSALAEDPGLVSSMW